MIWLTSSSKPGLPSRMQRGGIGAAILYLTWGLKGGNAQVIRALIRAGAGSDKDAKNFVTGRTPLHVAAVGGKEAVAKALIMAGADVNIRDAEKDAPLHPLHLAIQGGHGGLVETLLLSGADPNTIRLSGDYPMHLAARRGLDEAVLALVQKGVDLNSFDANCRTPLYVAGRNLSTVKKLRTEGANVNIQMEYSKTVLHYAAESSCRSA